MNAWGNSRVPLIYPAGSLAWASDLTRPTRSSPATWAKLDPAPPPLAKKNRERERDLWFSGIFILRSVFWYCKKYKSCIKIPGFQRNIAKIYIYLKTQKDVSMHSTNTLKIFWTFLLFEKISIWNFKNVF